MFASMIHTLRIPIVLAIAGASVLSFVPAAEAQFANPESRRAFDLVNQHRRSKGLKDLRVQSTLAGVAQRHAENMARQERMEHVLDGKAPGDRIRDSGYRAVASGENIHWNSGAADPGLTALRGWINSPPHLASILNGSFTEAGMGAARSRSGRWYFCQVFARPMSEAIRVTVRVVNTTSYTVRFRIGSTTYNHGPRATSDYWIDTADGRANYGIEWPRVSTGAISTSGGESGFLTNRARYEMRQSNGQFRFVAVGSF